MGILEGKRILVTGVLTDQSIAFHVARLAQQEGAQVVLTSFGRALSLTKRSATRLPAEAPVVELDVTSTDDLDSLASRVGEHVEALDGVLHSIGFAPESALGGRFLQTDWPDVSSRGVRVLAQVTDSGVPAAARARLIRRRPGLRCDSGVADVRLDGRGEGCP